MYTHAHKSHEIAFALKKAEQVLMKYVCVCVSEIRTWVYVVTAEAVGIIHICANPPCTALEIPTLRDRDLSVIAFLNSPSVCEQSCDDSYSSSLSAQHPRIPCGVCWQAFLLASGKKM